jgi:hypothetical protein
MELSLRKITKNEPMRLWYGVLKYIEQKHGTYVLRTGANYKSPKWTTYEGDAPGLKRGRGVMLTAQPLLVPRLRKSRSCTSSPPERYLCV